MTSHRAYRRALPHGVAVREIKAFAGTQFDPEVVEHFLEAIAEDQKGAKLQGRAMEDVRARRRRA